MISVSSSSVYHTLYARQCPSNIEIRNVYAAADSYFIRHSWTRSLPSILLRGIRIKPVPGFSVQHRWTCHLHKAGPAPPSWQNEKPPLHRKRCVPGNNSGFFPRDLPRRVCETCCQDRSARRSPRLRLKCVLDAAFWLELISGLDCNLLISLTPAVSD